MRKLLIGLSAGAFMLSGLWTVSAFAGDGLGFGVALSGTKITASGSETEGGEVNSKSVHNTVTIGSVFAEYTTGWVTLGVDYIPGSADVSDKAYTRNDTETSVTSTATTTATSRTQKASAEVSDHYTYYVEIGSTAFLKAGYAQMSVATNESLGTGSTYGNVDIDGILLGVGLKSDWGNNGFIKLEGTYTDYEDLSITSGVARTGVSTNNKITADLDVGQIKIGLGYRF